MATKLFVGNIPWSLTDADLRVIFMEHGTVISAEVVLDQHTGRSRGFGFVVMGSEEECMRAIQALDQEELGGRKLNVNVARRQDAARVAS